MTDTELVALALRVSKLKSKNALREIFCKRLAETYGGRQILNSRDISVRSITRLRSILK